MLNALTIDVEDYFQVSAFEGRIARSDWDAYPSRVVASTRELLRIFDRHQVRATFFVLGWVANRFPELVRDIARAGHEVGCHSYWHRLIYELTPDAFRQDLRNARDILEDITGCRVTAYRAPSYSITRQSLWALDILCAEGFESDSSIFPVYHDRYGIPDAQPHPHRYVGPHGGLWEFPPTVYPLGRFNLPVSGGGYFRLYPAWWTAHCFRRINQGGWPCVFYLHPWEIDPDQPRLPCPWRTRVRHYLNLSRTRPRLEWLLTQFRFGTLSDSLATMRDPSAAGVNTAEVRTALASGNAAA